MSTSTSDPATSAQARIHLDVVADDIVAIGLEGEFDMDNAPLIARETQQALDQGNHLILDLSAATFIDTTVINLLYRTHAAATRHGRVAVLQLARGALVDRVLQFSGIEKAMSRSHNRETAIKRIRQLENVTKGTWPITGLFLRPDRKAHAVGDDGDAA